MPCYHPLPAWYARERNPSGKRGVVFNAQGGTKGKLQLPCGRCIGCRLERSRQWAVRCVHEAQMWERNCFITLTYRPEDLPPGGSLVPEHFVLFMKRLRSRFDDHTIRFFHCGEYGDQFDRPHHHAILFNHDFDDKVLFSQREGVKLYTSQVLSELWRFGFCTIGDCSFESAAYIARYSLKKVHGERAAEHYAGRKQEYLTMSRRPGIGYKWLVKYQDDVYPSDSVVVRGVACKPPKYYDKVLEDADSARYRAYKFVRAAAAAKNPDGTGSRLIVREVVREAAIKALKREV